MSALQKIFKENSVGMVVIAALVLYGIYYWNDYLSRKGMMFGSEKMSGNLNSAYVNGNGASVQAAMPQGQNEVYSSANGIQTSMPGAPSTCNTANIQNPSELLPRDKNSQWAQLNPSGKGELANVNLLRAGYHIGIDTIGQSLRNANLQIRSEPANPQLSVGPWNQSTIEPDFMRPPLEIGAGGSQ